MSILWFIDKEFDISLDTATWVQVTKYIQTKYPIYLSSGYRHKKIQFCELDNEIIYLESSKIPFVKRFLLYYSQLTNFKKIINKCKSGVLLFNSGNIFLIRKAIKLKKKYKYKLLLDIRTLPTNSNRLRNAIDEYLFKKTLKSASKYFDGVAYITDEIKRYCAEKYCLPEHRSEIWSSGVDVEHFKFHNSQKKKDIFQLIYHGSVSDNRGLQNVVMALSIKKIIDIEFIILGSGIGMKELKELTERLNLREIVKFLDPVPYKDVPHYINQADIGILPFPNWPGWNTSSPIKLFEYLACCKPVIVTKIPAHINVLGGKDFAFWADRSTPEDIARAIEAAYAKRSEFENLGKKAREFVIENYTWEKQAQKLEKFIVGHGIESSPSV